MKEACYGRNGPLVDVEEFIRRATSNYKAKRKFPYCPACGSVLEVYGPNSTNVMSRFDHPNAPPSIDPLDECDLSSRRDPRFDGLAPSGWDHQRGIKIRAQFFAEENVKRAYVFCLRLCRIKNLPLSLWSELIKRADRKNIWSYKDIQLWTIPYILLSLGNFTGTGKRGSYDFHFILQKPRGTDADTLWVKPEACSLVKVFSSSGCEMKADDNPFPLSERAMMEKAGDIDWVNENTLRALRRS
ncbi:hypothetical protein ACSHT0_15385 [Tepidicaulis sp. LMO-SS28]|uniref:hypothetical protein n=1 Tax=Tepidicaulis sp. LMO-SS28 TaxID=3447455 RepID=UPI003EDF8904